MTENEPRIEPIYPALWKPRLWLACPPLMLVIVGLCASFTVPVSMLSHNVLWIALGAVLLAVAVPALRALARMEPEIVEVMVRYQKHAKHYAAIGSVGSVLPAPRRHLR